MNNGYWRGYYSSGQLTPRQSFVDKPKKSNGSGWLTLAVVAGLGAAIWWWVLPAIGPKAEPEFKPGVQPSFEEDTLEQLARSRGFSSVQEYEDAVAEMIRELMAAGAKIELAPYLRHLVTSMKIELPPHLQHLAPPEIPR